MGEFGDSLATGLPDFDAPPLVEVALGVQFSPVFALRPIELGPLRDQWRANYPLVQELPPLPPVSEGPLLNPPAVQLSFGPTPQARVWFISEPQTELVQIQQDKLIVNWRQTTDDASYPRYPRVREVFEQRARDVDAFLTERALGALEINQVEVTYINAIDSEGGLERVLRNWAPMDEHHLASPSQTRAGAVFEVPDLGQAPVRMYVTADPGQRPDGRATTFLTITVRGAPANASLEAAAEFMDIAHRHVVTSFAELTPSEMHAEWGRKK